MSRPPILGIAHIALRVRDTAEARNFFGHVLGFDELPLEETAKGKMRYAYFKVSDDQYIALSPTLSSPTEDRLIHIAYRTPDARGLRRYLAGHGVAVPGKLRKDSEGDLSFSLKDPAGHTVEFIQYLPGSVESRNFGRFLSSKRTSRQIIHAGETVDNRTAADHFYGDMLGYRLMWYGGMTDTQTDWVDMVVPERKPLAGVYAERPPSFAPHIGRDEPLLIGRQEHPAGLSNRHSARVQSQQTPDRARRKMAAQPLRSGPDARRGHGIQARPEALLLADANLQLRQAIARPSCSSSR